MAFWGRFLAALAVCLAVSRCQAQYTYGQATWYEPIDNGFCGFGKNIPSNGFVGAWPFIETSTSGAGFWQPSVSSACGLCFEVSCVPQFVESADGSIYLDRRDACADPSKAIVIKVVDECRCSLPRNGGPKGNYLWCCNTATPKLRINRHIDLSKQAFTALAKGGNFNVGILGIRYRQVSCDRLGASVTLPSVPPPPANLTTDAAKNPVIPTAPPGGMNWNDMTHTTNQPLGNTQQCGGQGGFCFLYGGAAACADRPFTGYKCAEGLTCKRQYSYYWQCLKPAGSGSGGSSGGSGGSSSGGSGGSSGSGSKKILQINEQCGGSGGSCKSVGKCADDPYPGHACASGFKCVRQNMWYYQCLDSKSIASLGSSWAVKKPQTTDTCPKYVGDGMQCGGKGGYCATDLPGKQCADKVAKGVCCEPGRTCVRQNEWYWECKVKA